MGPLSYIRSVIDRNVITRRMTLLTFHRCEVTPTDIQSSYVFWEQIIYGIWNICDNQNLGLLECYVVSVGR